jgi:UDP-glucose 4-epimerase
MLASGRATTLAAPASSPLASGLAGLRVLVTGGAGFIGSHVVDRLLAADAAVTVLDDFSTGRPGNLAPALANGWSESNIRSCDVRSAEAALAVSDWRPAVLVHLAAQTSVPLAVRAPAWDADVNIRGTLNLLDAAAAAGVRGVVFAASCAVYGHVSAGCLPVSETQPMNPATPYGMSKAAAINYLAWFRRWQRLPSAALVLANVYGPRQQVRCGGVIATFASALAHGRQPIIFGDGRQTRDFVHVDDVADAFVGACARPDVGVVNIGTGIETRIDHLCTLVCETTRVQMRPAYAEAAPDETPRMALANDRARRTLGWRPHISLTDGIRRVVAERAPTLMESR